MNNAQKIIKYVAIAFSIFLAFSIIASIVTGVLAILGISNVINIVNDNVETMDYTKEYVNIYNIELDISAAELEITSSDVLKIEGTNIPVDYKFEEKDGVLKVKNKKVAKNSKLVIYIPSDMNELDIDIGAGKIGINDVTIKELILDTGAANASINKLNVNTSANIDAGVGAVVVKDSDISNLDMDAGVGSVTYNGYLRGISSVNCGVGNLDINLLGTEKMYKITAEKGIGELKINGTRLSGTQTIGEGTNHIKISGGIGSVNVTY